MDILRCTDRLLCSGLKDFINARVAEAIEKYNK
jgi:hypothetical protein